MCTAAVFLLLFFLMVTFCVGFGSTGGGDGSGFRFSEAPDYRNRVECLSVNKELVSSYHPSLVHVALTLDSEYLRGSVAAVHSVLRHTTCQEKSPVKKDEKPRKRKK
ncbi:hypothetical protein V6N13_059744 [Hibiscus sabdariffa]|uniref:Secreted protein n=1 Tax=Hibiscus sabdariffa TaxID=183260 RepID=A0ABR2GC45_9ROSI